MTDLFRYMDVIYIYFCAKTCFNYLHQHYIVKLYILITECDNGTYGYNCANNCSGHCLNKTPCNKQTGHCDRGCKPGYTDDNCIASIYILQTKILHLRIQKNILSWVHDDMVIHC